MQRICPASPEAIILVLDDDDCRDRLVFEDNYEPEHMRGHALCVSLMEGLNAEGTHAYAQTWAKVERAQAEALRDWLNAWLVRYEPPR